MASIKTLIVDDSVVYRSQIRAALSGYAWIDVVGTASNGRIALERLKANNVDLLILDLEMPDMDGLQTLRELRQAGSTVKVLVFSSASKRGAEVTLEALRLGASDFVPKPGAHTEGLIDGRAESPADHVRQLLEPKLRAFFPDRFQTASVVQPASARNYPKVLWDLFRPDVLLIGSSTGGPTALESLVPSLGRSLQVPILIAQHMPPIFTATLAERLSRLSGLTVKEGFHGEVLVAGQVYVAPGGYHMTIMGSPDRATIQLDQGPLVNSVRPAVDRLFESAVKVFGPRCLGVVLTGMGHDGRQGAQAIKASGGAVLIQDRESSVVYGMPGAVFECGAYDKVLDLKEMASVLSEKIGGPATALTSGERNNA